MTDICADCGKPIGMDEGSYYRKVHGLDIGESFHSTCGDPLGLKARDAAIDQLRTALIGLLCQSICRHDMFGSTPTQRLEIELGQAAITATESFGTTSCRPEPNRGGSRHAAEPGRQE